MHPTSRYVKPGLAEKQFGVDRRTLQKWAEAGAIRSVQPGGVGRERLYDVSSLGDWNPTTLTAPTPPLGTAAEPARSTGNVDAVDAVYARVSTRKQLDDLGTQLGDLQRRHPDAHVFSDVGSGLNFKRKGLLSLLELAFEGRLRSVHVAHKDRLCRFAFDLLEHVFRRHGAQIVVDAHDGDAAAASPELELAEDVLAVVTVFGARLYGKRSAGNRRKRKRDAAAATAASGAAAEAGAQDGQGASSTDRATDGAGTDGAEAQGDTGPAPAGLGWAAADLQGAHGLDSDAEADAEGLLCGGAVGVQ
jgi:putative resolvase